MSDNSGKPKSDWRAIAMTLLQIGVLFVPVAVCMLVLAGLSPQKPSAQPLDSVQTGSIGNR